MSAASVDRFGGEQLTRVEFVGDPFLASSHQDVLRRDLVVASGAAFVMVALLLGTRFRRARYALLCLLPLVCGVSVALGFMSLVGIELNLLTLGIAPILIGIGVDDGVHMVGRFEQGEEPETVLRETGAAMTMTTLTTTAAFLCLGLASFAGFRELGLVAAVGLLACRLASLHLLPIVYRVIETRPQSAVKGGNGR